MFLVQQKSCALMTGVISLANNDMAARTPNEITDKLPTLRMRREIYPPNNAPTFERWFGKSDKTRSFIGCYKDGSWRARNNNCASAGTNQQRPSFQKPSLMVAIQIRTMMMMVGGGGRYQSSNQHNLNRFKCIDFVESDGFRERQLSGQTGWF
ncbi:hypothetical protein CDAR_168301 [Caerostris darwini]|uniref:Uncharacterized protein n=1 Tax=Caerostris darwini TaxID=1538125 RepID=A0AAV4T2Q4_9ARAC|nr:hypothetical protein CDAR_168301 [Caerostris darwini]